MAVTQGADILSKHVLLSNFRFSCFERDDLTKFGPTGVQQLLLDLLCSSLSVLVLLLNSPSKALQLHNKNKGVFFVENLSKSLPRCYSIMFSCITPMCHSYVCKYYLNNIAKISFCQQF